ncbi:hypothetical protein P5673_031180 [Acropora cervicornis]|uniref:Endonuclease/exonuclease/phosphatase domain-containing protein n=1 Tax=Acropora cervicornis TaxID=6130 RepID=A0AAD9PT42_ACRCE|nr:hypothetical protein P5673_031180 [Acropora cervicornis]
MASELNATPKDIRVGHLNICSLRNKIYELRLIQNICRFDILGITETHLNSTDADHDIHIDGLENAKAEATRITTSTETLIHVIATNKTEFVWTTGVLPLGITDHSLVYATLRLKRKRPPPTVITVRNFKQFNSENFKAYMELFDDMDDIPWVWNQLFRGVCDSHAPLKEIKVRSVSSP